MSNPHRELPNVQNIIFLLNLTLLKWLYFGPNTNFLYCIIKRDIINVEFTNKVFIKNMLKLTINSLNVLVHKKEQF